MQEKYLLKEILGGMVVNVFEMEGEEALQQKIKEIKEGRGRGDAYKVYHWDGRRWQIDPEIDWRGGERRTKPTFKSVVFEDETIILQYDIVSTMFVAREGIIAVGELTNDGQGNYHVKKEKDGRRAIVCRIYGGKDFRKTFSALPREGFPLKPFFTRSACSKGGGLWGVLYAFPYTEENWKKLGQFSRENLRNGICHVPRNYDYMRHMKEVNDRCEKLGLPEFFKI